MMNGYDERSQDVVGGLSVLVVEDDVDAAQSFKVLLGLFGHRVTVATDGPTAVELAATTEPDVALIDIGLPRLDGYAVAARLWAQSDGRRPLLVAITGSDADRRRSHEAGIHLHLTKPVDPDMLRRLLGRFARVVAHAGTCGTN